MSTHSHDGAGHVLVTSGNGDAGVVSLGTSHRLDTVRDDLASLQAEAHALVAHCNPIRDTYCVVLPTQHALVLDGALNFFAQIEQVVVARVALPPDGGDANMTRRLISSGLGCVASRCFLLKVNPT